MADSNTGSEDHVIKKPLNLATITRELRTVVYRWHDFGVQLSIGLNALRKIEIDYRHDGVEQQFSEIIKFWLEHCQDKSWEKIADVLRYIEEPQLASRVAQYDHHGAEATGSLLGQQLQPYLQSMVDFGQGREPSYHNQQIQPFESATQIQHHSHLPSALPHHLSHQQLSLFHQESTPTRYHTDSPAPAYYHSQSQTLPRKRDLSQHLVTELKRGAISGSCDPSFAMPPSPKVPRLQQDDGNQDLHQDVPQQVGGHEQPIAVRAHQEIRPNPGKPKHTVSDVIAGINFRPVPIHECTQLSPEQLRKRVQLILHTCNENANKAVLKLLSPPAIDGHTIASNIVYDGEGFAKIGMFGNNLVAVPLTGQGDNARGNLQTALEIYKNATAIVGIGTGYGNPRKPDITFGDVMVSEVIVKGSKTEKENEYTFAHTVPVHDPLLHHSRNLKSGFDESEKFQVASNPDRTSKVHLGTIVSTDTLVKTAATRDKLLATNQEAIGGEMEGWVLLGVLDEMRRKGRIIGIIIIKGVADFGDESKEGDRVWQPTAALAAVHFLHYVLRYSHCCLPPTDDSHESCQRKLKEYYSHQPEIPDSTWPPVKASKHVKLALIKSQAIDFGSDFARETVRGSIDDIMKKKDEIAYEEAFNNLEDGARVLIEGRPGCGKTTLIHKISRDCALGNILQSHMLFLAHLRRFGNRADIGLEDILHGVNVEFTPEEIEHLSTHIKTTGGKGCVFALDGLDEYNPERIKDTFISKLMKKELYPNAVVIIASRPAATQKFRRHSSKRIEVLGFRSEQVKEYVDSYFADQTEMAEGLMSYLDLHPNVMHMAYLPLHTAMICSLYEVMGSNLPSTETEIYLDFTLSTIYRALRKIGHAQVTQGHFELDSFDKLDEECTELFTKICELAYRATITSKQVFSYPEVQDILKCKSGSAGNDESTLGLITIDRHLKRYGLSESYTFLHLTFQEYLAAYHITRQSSDEQHQIIQKYEAEKRLAQVWKFYCGTATFSNAKSLKNLKLLLDGVKKNTLLCLQCTYEAKSDFACNHMVTSQDGKLSLSGTLNPTDTTALGYVLSRADQSSTPCTELSLKSCRFGPESLDALVKATGDEIQHLETISFHRTEIKTNMEGGLTEFLKKLKTTRTLDLSHCKLKLHTLSLLQSQSAIPSTLTTLNFGDNSHLGARAVRVIQSIKDALPNLKTLEIPWPKMSYGGCLKLLHGVDTGFWADATEIYLDGNNIGDDGAQFLAEGLSHCTNLQTLILSENNIGADGAQSLAEGLSHCTNLQTLRIAAGNNIGTDGAQSLAEVLSHCTNLQTLNLDSNNIGTDGAQSLAEGLSHCTNLQTLSLGSNNIGTDGAQSLAEGLSQCTNLQTLYLQENNIGADGAQSLAEGLSHCTNLQILYLWENNIGDDGAKSLAEGLSHCTNLQRLSLRGNSISDESVEHLTRLIKTAPKMKTFYLTGNKFSESGRVDLRKAKEERNLNSELCHMELVV